MTKLIVPDKVYRSKAGGKKWHLLRPRPNAEIDRRIVGDVPMTACKLLLWDGSYIEADIEDVVAGDICQRCLGPLGAVD